MKKILYITTVFVILLVAVNYLGSFTLGKKPALKEKENSNHLRSVSLNKYPKLKKIYENLDFKDANIDILKVKKLKNELQKAYKAERINGENGRSLAFYYLDLLLKLKDIDPNDKATILELADISFERQVFEKSKEYYYEYLNLNPEDYEVRGRLASSLTFLGKFNVAINELNKILAKKPKHFQALAYKAIALAQQNKIEEAISIGKKALENAPTDEAYTRFGSYLEKLKSRLGRSPLETYFITNSVTKNKFLKLSENEKEIKVYIKDFPFENMPEFAKEKFKENVKKHSTPDKQVKIIDTTTNKELVLIP